MTQQTNKSEIVLYTTPDGSVKIDTIFQDETIWLTQKKMAELFAVNVPAISKHLNNIFAGGELQKEATVSKIETVQKEGNRSVTRQKEFYNLDAIIAVGYRVNSKRATQFRTKCSGRPPGKPLPNLLKTAAIPIVPIWG